MTTHEQFLHAIPDNSSLKDSQASDSLASVLEREKHLFVPPKLFQGSISLRRRLLMTVLPAVLIPLAITSAIGFNVVQNQAKRELVSNLENSVILTSGTLLGVTKAGVRVNLNQQLMASVGAIMSSSEKVQIIDTSSGKILNTVSREDSQTLGAIIGGNAVLEVARLLQKSSTISVQSLETILHTLEGKKGVSNISVKKVENRAKNQIVSFEFGGRLFNLATIPNTSLVTVASVDLADVKQAGLDLLKTSILAALLMGAAATAMIILLTRNILVEQVNHLIQEQKAIAQEQKEKKEILEQEIYQLLNEVEGALDGDLTVRASLTSMEMSTVADLFNAIIDNLKDIAIQVKHSTGKVSVSLLENEQSIEHLANEAIKEVAETRKTLGSVEAMSQSIGEVSGNASKAAILADDTYYVTQEGTKAIDQTVESILSLRTTVGETSKKMKRLGESSQKISQVVSLIEEIALKTNLLAINASIEASRAGEQGQGFTVVAEQVGALAEQSASATKEIAQIVADIQAETQEVSAAMELGTSQVVDSTRLVKSAKLCLGSVLDQSRHIKELMQQISAATVSQVDTSSTVTDLMLNITKQSEQRLASSKQVAQSMQATAKVAKQLESAVEQFKVND